MKREKEEGRKKRRKKERKKHKKREGEIDKEERHVRVRVRNTRGVPAIALNTPPPLSFHRCRRRQPILRSYRSHPQYPAVIRFSLPLSLSFSLSLSLSPSLPPSLSHASLSRSSTFYLRQIAEEQSHGKIRWMESRCEAVDAPLSRIPSRSKIALYRGILFFAAV